MEEQKRGKHKLEEEIRQQLFALQDKEYLEFQSKLIPTIAKETVIGVRTPELRKFAKNFAKQPGAMDYLKLLPHVYYEENNLHGCLIETIKDYKTCVEAVDAFLPYVDNWATCDLLSSKIFKKHLPELLSQIKIWLQSDATYTIRYGIGRLMAHYLDEEFQPEYPELVAAVKSEEYYVNMMIAWYFATALAKQYDAILPYVEQKRLDTWTHNKTIQKAVESNRITEEQKRYLKTLKLK